MRTLTFNLNGFPASVALPDNFFDGFGRPRWHLLNSRFSNARIEWSDPIGAVPDEDASNSPRSNTDAFEYYRELFAKLFQKRPARAEEIQNAAITLQQKIAQLEKELAR